MTKLTRRRVLVSIGVIGGLGGGGTLLRMYGPGSGYRERLVRLDQLFNNLAPCQRLGQRLLASGIVPNDVDALSSRLLIGLKRREPADLTDFLKRNIQSDFFEGRTHLVEGWVLAKTEACLCALLALLAPAAAAKQVATVSLATIKGSHP